MWFLYICPPNIFYKRFLCISDKIIFLDKEHNIILSKFLRYTIEVILKLYNIIKNKYLIKKKRKPTLHHTINQ